MRDFCQMQCLFYLLIIIYHARLICSYGDPELQYYGDKFERDFIENHQVKHNRASKSCFFAIQLTAKIILSNIIVRSTSLNSSGIYVISGYYDPSISIS